MKFYKGMYMKTSFDSHVSNESQSAEFVLEVNMVVQSGSTSHKEI
jgi:hypothetical protein